MKRFERAKASVVCIFDQIELKLGDVDVLLSYEQAAELAELLIQAADHANQYCFGVERDDLPPHEAAAMGDPRYNDPRHPDYDPNWDDWGCNDDCGCRD